MTHVTRLSFCGVRRLNTFKATSPDMLQEWMAKRCWYNFKTINLFIGVNGGGKSTILELIDILREPRRAISLPRENRKNNRLTAFHIEFSGDKHLIAMSYPHAIKQATSATNIRKNSTDIQSLDLISFCKGKQLFSFIKNISKTELDPESWTRLKGEFAKLKCNVAYWNIETEVSIPMLVALLNRAASHLPGILSPLFLPKDEFEKSFISDGKKSNPFHAIDEQRVGILLSDDITQPNKVHVSALPSGWRRLASIISWMEGVPEGSVCLLEEPETHLHPRLQRYLAKEMEVVALRRKLQLFISTHSTVFQQSNLWQKQPGMFAANAETIEEYSSAWQVMDALGIRGSDISQSNGVVWVEGPSDRIYIKHWLSLYCKENGKTEPKENVDYSFNLYGGAMLSHMSLNEQESFISMLSMNRNLVLVMDRDTDFIEDADGKLTCIKPNSAKARVLAELEAIKHGRCKIWVTDKYTIESYLPLEYLAKYFTVDANGRLKLDNGSKVEIARAYCETYLQLDTASSLPVNLRAHIHDIFCSIERWNT
ncbi:ATP-dependent nuclease [Herminiimonas aquatilis]|uniref:ATP-dependent endonuclease n=1 Tax=Herminiimonas aquatilis TaxID=345342 RepID=A0ABW2J3E8_9BURK